MIIVIITAWYLLGFTAIVFWDFLVFDKREIRLSNVLFGLFLGWIVGGMMWLPLLGILIKDKWKIKDRVWKF